MIDTAVNAHFSLYHNAVNEVKTEIPTINEAVIDPAKLPPIDASKIVGLDEAVTKILNNKGIGYTPGPSGEE